MSYQQYQQYQQSHPSITTSTFSGATLSTPELYWNGSAWVNSGENTVNHSTSTGTTCSTHSTYVSDIQSTVNSVPLTLNIGGHQHSQKSLVEVYTGYYHGWQQYLKEYERLPDSHSDRQQHMDWARYYADQSSRAAHYYYEQSTRGLLNPPSPPFDLPPAPPTSTKQPQKMQQQQQQQQRQQQPTHPSNNTRTSHNFSSMKESRSQSQSQSQPQPQPEPPSAGSLTHYVQRCLQSCTTAEQRAVIQAEIENLIAKAIQEGNLHTRNWHLEPLIPAPSSPNNDIYSYYGPASNFSNSNSHPLPPHSSSLSSNHSMSHVSFPLQTKAHTHKQSSPKKAKKQKIWSADDEGLDRSAKALQKRQKRFSGPGGLLVSSSVASESTTTESDYGQYMGLRTIGQGILLTEQDFERMTVKGTCATLEKEYLRLTAPPRAELVRPEHILKLHLENLKQDYYNGKQHDYLWFCSQLKAVRQDLTIQRIQNKFAIDVYETHARIALLEGDLNEFNQCQTQLKDLYDGVTHEYPDEFLAYRLLYHVFLTTSDKYDAAALEITKLLRHCTGPALQHALQVREAVASSDYLQFFRLQRDVPNLGDCLTRRMAPTMRLRALMRITKAFRPSLDLTVCKEWLGLGSIEECRSWIESCGGMTSETIFLTKESDGAIHEPRQEKTNSLI